MRWRRVDDGIAIAWVEAQCSGPGMRLSQEEKVQLVDMVL